MAYKVFLIACETSGDLHGAHLARHLQEIEPDLELRGLGGPRMAEAGVELLDDMTRMSALGLGDVLRLYFTYRRIFYRALAEVKNWGADLIVTIDSPAFNLRFAKKIHRKIPVLYYISPQIWAWGGRRIHTIKKTIAKMLTILPFEAELYKKAGVPCEFVGHPLLEEVKTSAGREMLRSQFEINPGETAVALMPGSREKEVKRILPVMLESAARLKQRMPRAVFFLTQSPNVARGMYDGLLKKFEGLSIRRFEKNFYDLIHAMDFALVASGTATLETALLGTPYFLLYKTSWSTYFVGRRLVRVPFLGIVNILAKKRVVPEFIQQDAQPAEIAREAEKLLGNQKALDHMRRDFFAVREKLGKEGVGARAAGVVRDFLHHSRASRTVSSGQASPLV